MRLRYLRPRFLGVTLAGALLLPVLAASPVQAQLFPWRRSADNCPPFPCPTATPPAQAPVAPPQQQPATERPPQVAEEPSFAPERFAAVGGESVALATPSMIGDLIGPFVRIIDPATRSARGARSLVPLVARGAFKIADNESARPLDRVFFNYNYFGGVGEQDGFSNAQVHREIIGFEKTFLDGNASIGMRLPFFETAGAGSLSTSDIGDLSIVLKYAFLNDRSTGDVVSGGLVVTAPTAGEKLFTFNGQDIHDTLLQPYVAYLFMLDDFYVHGFTSLVVPTDSRDVTILFNDIGVGYWVYRCQGDRLITGVAPTIEAHVTTPLNHRDSDTDPIVIPDWVVLTGGVNVLLNHRSNLLLGVATPITGPKPFDIEATVLFNFRF